MSKCEVIEVIDVNLNADKDGPKRDFKRQATRISFVELIILVTSRAFGSSRVEAVANKSFNSFKLSNS
jgi:hypothetical protein